MSLLGKWTTSTASEFDALLEQTTSPLLPSSIPPALTASLHLADLIRSSALPPLTALTSLLKRLANDNPNVQLLALQVLDVCVKNGGTPFLRVVAGFETAKVLESLAREGQNEVRQLALAKIQDWATAFQGKDELRSTELVRCYERLRRGELPFPKKDPNVTAAMVDSLSAPEWQDAPYCSRCRTNFTLTNRKHHCRNCGLVFDQACSASSTPLPHYGVLEPVRVCDGCSKKLKEGGGRSGERPSNERRNSVGSPSSSARHGVPERSNTVSGAGGRHRGAAARSREEEDLQKAIDASLADVGGHPSSTNGPAFALRTPDYPSGRDRNSSTNTISYANQLPRTDKPTAAPPGADEDPDLAAAIAASLRDVAIAPSAPSESDEAAYVPAPPAGRYDSSPYPTLPPASRYTPLKSYDLDPASLSDLSSFNHLLANPAPPTQYGQQAMDSSYAQARTAHERLERGMEDTERRREILLEMEGKLGEAGRLYQGLLGGRQEQYRAQEPYYPAQQAYQYPAQAQQPYQQYSHPYPAHQEQYPVPPPHQEQYAYPAPTTNYEPPTQIYDPSSNQSTYPLYAPSPAAYAPPEPRAAALPAPAASAPSHPVPAGFYKPSQFPSVPTGLPLPAQFPSVPVENPWETSGTTRQEEHKEAEVGELIQL